MPSFYMTIPCSDEVRAGALSRQELSQCAVAMCINAATPAWVRVRHWSAPEQIVTNDKPTAAAQPAWDEPLTLQQELEVLASLASTAPVSPSSGTAASASASDHAKRQGDHSLTHERSLQQWFSADKRTLVRRETRLSWTQELFLWRTRRDGRAKVQQPPAETPRSEAVSCPHIVPDPTTSSALLPNHQLLLEEESLSARAAMHIWLLWARWCHAAETWTPSCCSYAGEAASEAHSRKTPTEPPERARHEYKFRRKRQATSGTSDWLSIFQMTMSMLLLFSSTAQARSKH